MNAVSKEEQLKKVMNMSKALTVLFQIANAFTGIGLAMTLIALTFASSFQLNLGNGDLGVTFFSQEQSEVVVNLYDTRNRAGFNVSSDVPDATQATRLVTQPDTMLRVTTGALIFLQVTIVLLVLEHLSKLFSFYAKGEIFTSDTVSRIRNIGYTVLAIPALSLLNSIFAAVIASMLDAPSSSVHLSMNMSALFAAIVILLIARIMDVGRSMREENELTI